MLLALLVIVVDEAAVLEEDEDPARAALLFVFRHAAGTARDFGKFDPVKVDDAGEIQEGPTGTFHVPFLIRRELFAHVRGDFLSVFGCLLRALIRRGARSVSPAVIL